MAEPVAPTPDNIAPLIVGEDIQAHYARFVFRCPVSGEELTGTAKIERDPAPRSLAGDVKKGFFRSLRYSVGSMVRSAFGYGAAGQIGSSVADAVMTQQHAIDFQAQLSPEQLAELRLEAFQSVRARFAWDTTLGRWVSAKVLRDLHPELVSVVQGTQVTEAWDQGVLARMLAEIASADGALADAEREMFYAFVGGGGVPSLDELLERPPVTAADLGETTPKVRYVMWLLAAAMAAGDHDFTLAEKTLLDAWAKGLAIATRDQQRGYDMVRDWVVDQALDAAYGDGKMTRAEMAEVKALATALGMEAERLDRLDARCRKRRGLI